jgi:hypothetical protein
MEKASSLRHCCYAADAAAATAGAVALHVIVRLKAWAPLTTTQRHRACRGKNANGQLADGTSTVASIPKASTFVGSLSIHAGGASTCIINVFGQRLCAGTSQFGQLATGSSSTINTSPVPTVIPESLAPASFDLAAPFVTVSDATNTPVCTLWLSVKVDATCDTTPPVFDPALEDIHAAATGADGAVVTYSPAATDGGVDIPVTCTPGSGSQFPLGDTTVTCTAGVTTGTFKVIGCGGFVAPTRAVQQVPHAQRTTVAPPSFTLPSPLPTPPQTPQVIVGLPDWW